MTEDQAIHKGRRASVELAETQWAFDAIKDLLVKKWVATGIDAVDTREKYFNAMKAIEMVRNALVEVIANGHAVAHSREMAALLSPAEQDRR